MVREKGLVGKTLWAGRRGKSKAWAEKGPADEKDIRSVSGKYGGLESEAASKSSTTKGGGTRKVGNKTRPAETVGSELRRVVLSLKNILFGGPSAASQARTGRCRYRRDLRFDASVFLCKSGPKARIGDWDRPTKQKK